jgi:hypothetical protein
VLVMDCGQGPDVCSKLDGCAQLPIWRALETTICELFDRVTMADIKEDVARCHGSVDAAARRGLPRPPS